MSEEATHRRALQVLQRFGAELTRLQLQRATLQHLVEGPGVSCGISYNILDDARVAVDYLTHHLGEEAVAEADELGGAERPLWAWRDDIEELEITAAPYRAAYAQWRASLEPAHARMAERQRRQDERAQAERATASKAEAAQRLKRAQDALKRAQAEAKLAEAAP